MNFREQALKSGPNFCSLLEEENPGGHANYIETGPCMVSLREAQVWGAWKVVFIGLPGLCVESRLPFLLPEGQKNRYDCGPCNTWNRYLPPTAEVSWPCRNVQVAAASWEQWRKAAVSHAPLPLQEGE